MKIHTFKKAERLSSKILINNLFEKGNSVTTQFPFRVIWQFVQQPSWEYNAQVLIGVSKRNFPLATDRNRIKRQIRELYRLNKPQLYSVLLKQNKQLALSVHYQAKEKLEMEVLKPAFAKLLNKLIFQLSANMDEVK